MGKMVRAVRITANDALEMRAHRALQSIMKHEKARESVAQQLIELARELGDDDDPSHQVMHSAS